MTVKWVDWRLYKNQAAADRAAARIANAPDLSWWTSSNSVLPKTTDSSLNNAANEKTKEIDNKVASVNNTINQLQQQASSMSGNKWSSTNYKDSDWYYSATDRNNATSWAEFWWSYQPQTTKTETSTSTSTPTSTSWFSAAETAKIRNAWDSLTYEQQQQKLKENPNLRANLSKYWAVEKTAPVSETPKEEEITTTETPKWDGWDYQDNSPERMSEIADNVNKFAITDPQLFANEETFRNFFIDWKGRTPEQEKFLMDFYKNRKMYNTLDNYTAEQIGDKYVNGEIPESYLTYLKNTDPERYAYVMDAKAAATDRIKDGASLDTINSLQWWEDTSTSKVIQWLKDNWLLVDKDWNLVDDRRENYASEEENKYLKEIADLNARNLDIDNTVKHTFDDLVERYPWASKATLMAMAQDINSDLLREKENNLVELTKFQWYVNYMQSERQEMNAAWANTISQLQQQYWMYYDYSPEWMSELLNAQYEAASPSLASAEWWTETQKRRAIEAALTWYYEKYWSIIERPMTQVIDDVIAYANNKWITLQQALQENFVTPLKSKDQYNTLASWWWSSYKFSSYEWADWVKHTIRYNEATWEWEEIFWEDVTYWSDGTVKFWENIRTWDTIWNDINSIWHILSSDDWLRVWTYYNKKNWHTYNVYANREDWIKAAENLLRRWYYWMTLADAAQKWIWQWKDISDAKTVIQQKWLWLNDKLSDANVRKFIEAIWQREWTLQWKSLDDWAKEQNNDFSQYKEQPKSTQLWYWENPMTDIISMIRIKWDLSSDEKKDLNFASKAYELMYELASSWDIDYLINSDEWQKFISNLKSASFTKNNEEATWTQVYNALKNNITDQRNLRTVNKLINVIELKLRKTSWAAISASEWNSNFDMLLPWVNEIPEVSLDKYRNFEKLYLMDYFNSAGAKTKWYNYIPLFSEDSPYYIKHKWYWDIFTTSNRWVVWIRWINYGSNWTWRSSNDIYYQIWSNS